MKEGKKGRPCPFRRHHAGEKELFNADHMMPPATYKALSSQMSCPSAPFNRQKAGTCTLVDGKLTNVHWEFIWGLSFCASDQTRHCLDLYHFTFDSTSIAYSQCRWKLFAPFPSSPSNKRTKHCVLVARAHSLALDLYIL